LRVGRALFDLWWRLVVVKEVEVYAGERNKAFSR
jgi:hypothetical protein